MMEKYRVTLSIFFIALGTSLLAQEDIKTIKEFVKESDEVFFGHVEVFSDLAKSLKKEIRNGLVTGDDLKPKKIGLITTYFFEEKFTFRKAHFLYVHSYEGDKNYFFDKMAQPLVDGVKSAFEGSEIELLTPSQFLSTSNEREDYEKLAKKLKTMDPFVQTINDNKMDASGGEFEFIYTLSKDGESSKIVDGLAEYAQQRGFDAILSIEINTKYMTKAITFNGLQFTLHSLNPDSKKGLLFNRYSLYSDMYYPVAFIKNGKLDWENFEGFESLGKRAAEDYIKYIDETIVETM